MNNGSELETLLEPIASVSSISVTLFSAIKIIPDSVQLKISAAVTSFLGWTSIIGLGSFLICLIIIRNEQNPGNKNKKLIILFEIIGTTLLIFAYFLLVLPEFGLWLSNFFNPE